MVRAITADVGDQLKLEGGRDLIGLLYAVTSATTKAASALSIFISYALLSAFHYDPRPHAVNGPAQIHGLELIFVSGPIVFVMLGGAAFIGYKLSAERHEEIRRKLAAREGLLDESLGLDGVAPTPGDVAVTRP
jgi:Na+/melibiose symporter-like transporter